MLLDGYTLFHEHIRIDLSKIKNNLDCNLDCKEQTIYELKKLYDKGVRNIIDQTNIGMGRDINYVNDIIRETKINIISSTGFYKQPFLPDYIKTKTVDELASIMIDEIENGIDNLDRKAEIIGEIGTSKNIMTKEEEKVFLASIIAQKKTNVPISTHTTLGTFAKEQVEFFRLNGADMSKLVIGHVELGSDFDTILNILKQDVYVAIDTIGKNNYLSDDIRVDILKKIEVEGLINKVVLSMDISRKSSLEYLGGPGYSYIMDEFIDMMLKKGISSKSIEYLLKENPKKIFGVMV